MLEMLKGKSPFYPGQPVPVELFVGRSSQVDRIMQRGVAQVSQGKPTSIFLQGEYGIGKSSLASFAQWLAEKEHGLLGIYAPLGGAKNLQDIAPIVMQAVMSSGIFDSMRLEKVGDWLGKYIGKQGLFGFTLNFEALKPDSPILATPFGMLQFLSEARKRLGDGLKGIFLVLDEINGITGDDAFAHFIKGLVDNNALSKAPLPLLLMLCGVEERRREMIQKHQPIDRIFDVVEIKPMNPEEMDEFFIRAFTSVGMGIDQEALKTLRLYSAGYPKIMHLVGDAAYWIDKDGIVDHEDAFRAVISAAEEVGTKYVDQQVYRALRSEDYHSILAKIAKIGPEQMRFTVAEVSAGLNDKEKKKFHNFLQRMKRLNVIRSGDVKGEYVFHLRMVRFYIWLQSIAKK